MILHFYGILVVVKSIGPSKAYNSHGLFSYKIMLFMATHWPVVMGGGGGGGG